MFILTGASIVQLTNGATAKYEEKQDLRDIFFKI